MDGITATHLHEVTQGALAITGQPTWVSPDDPDCAEVLAFVRHLDGCDGPVWALVPTDEKGEPAGLDVGAGAAFEDDSEPLPLAVELAADLIRARLSQWLLGFGWQLQSSVIREGQRWRLVDVLSLADGGGDRLDEEYPNGPDEMTVLCTSVEVVARHVRAMHPASRRTART